jgi:hypothetical protein
MALLQAKLAECKWESKMIFKDVGERDGVPFR